MKNFIICCLVCLVAVSVFAKMPDGFDKNETDKTKIEGWIKNSSEATLWEKDNLDIMLIVSDMSAEKTSYTDFKKVFKDYVKSETFLKRYKLKFVGEDRWKTLCVAFIYPRSRFTPYFEKVLTDPELNDSYYVKRTCYYQRISQKYLLANKELFRKYFKTCINENIIKDDNLTFMGCKRAIENYKNNMTNSSLGLTKEEIAEDLRYAKLLIFPNINKSEEWKQVCVTLELMIKSNQ